ncbi:MAG: hypothetical protein F9B45_22145 [Phycisphaera sp. RhM]|nr:hypothetical protein [Phycisphaera sp. RhM]
MSEEIEIITHDEFLKREEANEPAALNQDLRRVPSHWPDAERLPEYEPNAAMYICDAAERLLKDRSLRQSRYLPNDDCHRIAFVLVHLTSIFRPRGWCPDSWLSALRNWDGEGELPTPWDLDVYEDLARRYGQTMATIAQSMARCMIRDVLDWRDEETKDIDGPSSTRKIVEEFEREMREGPDYGQVVLAPGETLESAGLE